MVSGVCTVYLCGKVMLLYIHLNLLIYVVHIYYPATNYTITAKHTHTIYPTIHTKLQHKQPQNTTKFLCKALLPPPITYWIIQYSCSFNTIITPIAHTILLYLTTRHTTTKHTHTQCSPSFPRSYPLPVGSLSIPVAITASEFSISCSLTDLSPSAP